jgi:hypothetical protein
VVLFLRIKSRLLSKQILTYKGEIMIVNHELVKMVGSNTLFKGVSKDFLKSFIRPKNYFGIKEGTIIYSKGDDSTDLYLIVEGEVKIKFCEKNKVEHRFITDFFGEDELLSKEKRKSHAVANNDSILYSINSEELLTLTQQQSKITENLNKKNSNDGLYGLSPEAAEEDLQFEDNNLVSGDNLKIKNDFSADENSENKLRDNDLKSNPDELENKEGLPN